MNGVIILHTGDTVKPAARVVETSYALKAILCQCKQWTGTIVVISDDGEPFPIRVEFESGKRYWFEAHELERVGE